MDTKHISEIVIEALRKTYQNHLSLGEKGKVESGERNSFGQVTYKADLEAGKIFFSSLKKSRLSVKFISEEHGVEVKTGNKPQYLGVIDELDGSNCYKEGVGRYGTTVGIFDNLEPYYKNYLICVILEYTEGKIYYATKNKGGVCLDIGTNKISSIHSSKCSVLNSNKTTAAIDGGWLDANQVFVNALGGFEHLFVGNKANGGASCGYYIDQATGRVDLVGECTRKRNLEIAAAFGLVKEAGGVMVDLSGRDLAERKYLSFGQGEDEHIPILTASTYKLAQSFIRLLRLKNSN